MTKEKLSVIADLMQLVAQHGDFEREFGASRLRLPMSSGCTLTLCVNNNTTTFIAYMPTNGGTPVQREPLFRLLAWRTMLRNKLSSTTATQ